MDQRLCIAVIPARGGSKRIPKKNVRPFAGRPIIEYAIELAIDCRLFDRIIVSTDSSEIRAVAEKAGAEVPFLRPAPLADDQTSTADVLVHALEAVEARSGYDFACCLYPTIPFAKAEDLKLGLSLVSDRGSGSAFAVAQFKTPIWRAFERRDDETLTMIWPEHRDARTQDLAETFYDIGQFYWVPVAPFLDDPVLYTETSQGVLFPPYRAHDINTDEDWMWAERVFRVMQQEALQ